MANCDSVTLDPLTVDSTLPIGAEEGGVEEGKRVGDQVGDRSITEGGRDVEAPVTVCASIFVKDPVATALLSLLLRVVVLPFGWTAV